MIKTTINKLKNGLIVICVEDKSKNQTFAELSVKYGSKVKEIQSGDKIIEVKPGLAHLLEHTMIENSIYGNIATYFHDNYVYYNGFTGPMITYFPINTVKDFKKHLKVLLEYVNIVKFDEKKLEEIKKPVIDEIIKSRDRRYYKYNQTLLPLVNNKSKFEGNLGTIEDVQSISVDELKTVHDLMYQPSNQILSISGNFDTVDILKYVEDIYDEIDIPTLDAKILDEEETVEYETNELTIVDNNFDPICSLEYKVDTSSFTNEELLKLDYYSSCFLAYNFSEISKAYKKVKDERLSSFSFSSGKSFINKNILHFRIALNTEKFDEVKSIIEDVFDNLYLDEEYFEIWKKDTLINIIKREKLHNQVRKSIVENIFLYDVYYNEGVNFIDNLNFEEMKNLMGRLKFNNMLFVKEIRDVKK